MRIILCGFGIVGQSLAKLLISRVDELYTKYKMKPRIVAVCDSSGSAIDTHGINLNKLLLIKKKYGGIINYNKKKYKYSGKELINFVDAEVLVETTPSDYKNGEPGMTHIITAMKHGLHVVSVNKGPLALAFPSLMEIALYNNVLLKFSGTVGGGTPILDYAKNSLSGEKIISFLGILNGTTNYILTQMENNMSFNAALKDSKTKGYVEANESLDLDGYDAAAKLVILANWIMDMKVTISDIKIEGIRNVNRTNITKATKKNCAIKLISSCDNRLNVGLKEISHNNPLCVNGTLNAISFTSQHAKSQTIIGHGAGGIETASSIIRDLIAIRRKFK